MIDIVGALDLLDSCVLDRGEDHRPLGGGRPAASPARSDGALPAAAENIVTLALSKAGAPPRALWPLAHTSFADLYAAGRHPVNMTLGAIGVLRAAESAERRGQTWAMCLAAGLQAAARFVDLMPEGMAGCPRAALASSVLSRRTLGRLSGFQEPQNREDPAMAGFGLR
jgi:hypothetical protein